MTNLTKEYLDTVDFNDIECHCFDDYCIYFEFKIIELKDKIIINVFFDNTYLTNIDSVEQLDYFWYGMFKKPVRRIWKK